MAMDLSMRGGYRLLGWRRGGSSRRRRRWRRGGSSRRRRRSGSVC
jgi:hypothetical protein